MNGKFAIIAGAVALATVAAAQPAAATPLTTAESARPRLIEAQYVRPYYHRHHHWRGWGWGRPYHHNHHYGYRRW